MMKKLLVILLAGLMTFSLASCDLDSILSEVENQIEQQEQQTEENNDETIKESFADSNTDNDAETSETSETEDEALSVADFLKIYGFDEEDITPNHFVSFDELEMDGSTPAGKRGSTGYITINVDKDATTEEDFNAWFEKLYAKMISLSDDGKLYKDAGKKTEATSLADLQSEAWWAVLPGSSCMFKTELANGSATLHLAYRYDIDLGVYKLSIMYWS